MRVLILGGRAPVALDHARRFNAQGWQTFIGDSASCRTSGWSRSVAATFRLPPPRFALAAFAAALARIVREQRIDLVLPTCEEVFYLSRIREQLPSACAVFAAPFELLQQLHSKWTFLELAKDCGVNIPHSERVAALAGARAWAGDRAVVLKPEFSRFGVHVRLYPNGIPADAQPLPNVGPWIVQWFQRGTELCSYSIAVAGKLRAHVAYEPSYRLARSSSYYFEPRQSPAIEACVERLVARTGFTGQISFDWIVGADGTVTVLECNPRAISGVHLFDLTQPLPAIISGELATRVIPSDATPRMLGAVMLAVGLPMSLWRGTLRQWCIDWSRATDVLSARGDWRPAAGAIVDIANAIGHALRRRSSVRAATTRDIEWDGEGLSA